MYYKERRPSVTLMLIQAETALLRSHRPTVRSLCDCLLKTNRLRKRMDLPKDTEREQGQDSRHPSSQVSTFPPYSLTQMMGTLLYINRHLPQTSLLSVLVFYGWCSNQLLRSRTAKEISRWKNSVTLAGSQATPGSSSGPWGTEGSRWIVRSKECLFFPSTVCQPNQRPLGTRGSRQGSCKPMLAKTRSPTYLHTQLWFPCPWARPLLFSTQGWPFCGGRSHPDNWPHLLFL